MYVRINCMQIQLLRGMSRVVRSVWCAPSYLMWLVYLTHYWLVFCSRCYYSVARVLTSRSHGGCRWDVIDCFHVCLCVSLESNA
ncbi:uncharacterized protein BDW43DRAFT_260657 [Aspergillus alliaceus]|uniref:uncharacterized protein n=1 Tax=Petromyces alliaceus TaxID=209559 RepID=UPI0012A57122|nr:uncharacterized protein BDW43DRAFT_260657 [Aspergillus alliaceus]KAB8239149.1 hypothetical protein BDW43DRAFT_260657 [Aspergillus alliaceus]